MAMAMVLPLGGDDGDNGNGGGDSDGGRATGEGDGEGHGVVRYGDADSDDEVTTTAMLTTTRSVANAAMTTRSNVQRSNSYAQLSLRMVAQFHDPLAQRQRQVQRNVAAQKAQPAANPRSARLARSLRSKPALILHF